MSYRTEKDTLGSIDVASDKYWGAQTERSRQNFPIGGERDRMPQEIITALAFIKQAAALANYRLLPEKMTEEKCSLIAAAAGEIIDGKLWDHFPLVIWQTGSGTQSNMNVNEVIANRGNELAGKKLLHPNDDVNLSQSSNDAFPSAMRIAAVLILENTLLPSVRCICAELKKLEERYDGLIKTGRTHLQDAVPIRFSQEISGWRCSLEKDAAMLEAALPFLRELPLGGTAVGTGLNAPAGFDRLAAEELSRMTKTAFSAASNKFYALTSLDVFVNTHGILKALASDLMKMANDIRLLSSGPRCGLGELILPVREPGSSIMPGKVNPTQCEQVTMVAVQVMGNDTAVGFAASQGQLELNVYLPVCIDNFLRSAKLLSGSMESFRIRCLAGLEANEAKMQEDLFRSLMLVTALSPRIGYEKAAQTAQLAYRENSGLKEACLKLGYLSEEELNDLLMPEKMV
ncbi:MAG: class II fumarate hydratase [Solobacterium sp.]|nr:class II fumarate hydratase [Solobacterium sp.]